MSSVAVKSSSVFHGELMKKAKRLFTLLFGCFAAGVASVLVLSLVLTVVLGGEKANDIIFGVSPAIPAFAFGSLWYPFLSKRLR